MKKRLKTLYFPKALIFSTPLLYIFGAFLIIHAYPFWGVGMFLLVVIVLTTTYVTEIDLKKNTYKDYLFFLGLKLQIETRRFNKIERIVITRGRHKHRAGQLGGIPYNVYWHQFTATVIYDENCELILMTKKNKKELIKTLKDLAAFLNVEMEDRCGRENYVIDLASVR